MVVPSVAREVAHLTRRQAEVLRLAGLGLSGKQIGRHLGISVRTVEDHFSAMRQRTGARSQGELIAYGVLAGLVKPGGSAVPQMVPRSHKKTTSRTRVPKPQAIAGVPGRVRGNRIIDTPYNSEKTLRVGYARVGKRTQNYQAQLDALTAAHCSEIAIEATSTRGTQPKLRNLLATLQRGDTLVIYKADRIAHSINELLALLEDQLYARGINLDILTGSCAGQHRPDGNTIADKMLFMVAALAKEMERDLALDCTMNGLSTTPTPSRRSGRPPAVSDELLAIARVHREWGESVTTIAQKLHVGRSTLYRALLPSAHTRA